MAVQTYEGPFPLPAVAEEAPVDAPLPGILPYGVRFTTAGAIYGGKRPPNPPHVQVVVVPN